MTRTSRDEAPASAGPRRKGNHRFVDDPTPVKSPVRDWRHQSQVAQVGGAWHRSPKPRQRPLTTEELANVAELARGGLVRTPEQQQGWKAGQTLAPGHFGEAKAEAIASRWAEKGPPQGKHPYGGRHGGGIKGRPVVPPEPEPPYLIHYGAMADQDQTRARVAAGIERELRHRGPEPIRRAEDVEAGLYRHRGRRP